MTRKQLALSLTLILAIPLLAAMPQKETTAEILLGAALHQEEVEGNLEAAIATYEKILTEHSEKRALAARAQLHIGICYEKLGREEAQKAYQAVVDQYPSQQEAVRLARERLAALRELSAGQSAMATRRVWSPDEDYSVTLLNEGGTDGRYLTYGDRVTGNLVVRDLATGENRQFTNQGCSDHCRGAEYNKISRDGRQVVYAFCCPTGANHDNYDLRLVAVSAASSGAPPRILLSNDDVAYAVPLDWSPDGKQILAGIHRIDKTWQLGLISAADGSVQVLKTLDWRSADGQFSPDGRYIAYDIQLERGSPDKDVFVLATDGSRESKLVEYPGVDRVLAWAPDGKRILFASDRTGSTGAWSIGVAEGRPQGSPELVKRDIGDIFPIGATRSGALYYTLRTYAQDVYIASLDMATGKVTVPPAPVNPRLLGGGKGWAEWSPDGQYLAYFAAESGASAPSALHIRAMKTGEERELSLKLDLISYLGRIRWSPDGRSLLATGKDDKSRVGLYQIDVQTGAVAPIVQGEFPYGVWSADGKAIFYALRAPDRSESTEEDKLGIRVRDLGTGRDKAVYRPALPSSIRHLALSADGRWLAFVSVREIEITGKPAIEEALLVMPATGGDPREILKVHRGATEDWNGLAALEWTRDGDQLLYNWNRELWKISAKGGQPQKLGLPSTVARRSSVSIHPDGQHIAFTAGESTQEVWVMENFLPELSSTK
jgi:Tol biopolymer transport system component